MPVFILPFTWRSLCLVTLEIQGEFCAFTIDLKFDSRTAQIAKSFLVAPSIVPHERDDPYLLALSNTAEKGRQNISHMLTSLPRSDFQAITLKGTKQM